MMRTFVGVAFLLGLVGACGDDTDDDAAFVPLSDVSAKYAAALCRKLESCGVGFYALVFGNESCEAVLTKRVEEGSFAATKAAVDAGTITYDASLANQCLSAIDAADCDVLNNDVPEVCDRTFQGSVTEGGNCQVDEDCQGALRCKVDVACPGKCAPRAAASEACARDSDCQRGFVCDAKNRCSSPAGNGDSCGGTSGVDCEAGFLCVENQCKPLADILGNDEGAECRFAEAEYCKPGLSCVISEVVEATVVAKCEKPVGPGQTCRFGIPSSCSAGEYCPLTVDEVRAGKMEATCAPLPQNGETCVDGFPECAPNHRCGADDKCGVLQSIGGPCTNNEQCFSEKCQNGICAEGDQCAN